MINGKYVVSLIFNVTKIFPNIFWEIFSRYLFLETVTRTLSKCKIYTRDNLKRIFSTTDGGTYPDSIFVNIKSYKHHILIEKNVYYKPPTKIIFIFILS